MSLFPIAEGEGPGGERAEKDVIKRPNVTRFSAPR
jgi:hypothetical protein